MIRPGLQHSRWISGIVGLLLSVSCAPAASEDSSPCASGFVRNEQGLCRAEACLMPGPEALRTATLGGTAGTQFSVGDTLVLEGTHFSASSGQNTITFDGVPATSVTGDPADPTRRLFVVVPAGIPDAPLKSDDAPKSGVCIQAQGATSALGATSITVTPPRPLQPMISAVAPETQNEGGEITLTGANFTADAVVKIRNVSAAVVRTSSTEIVVTVPDFPDILIGTPVPSSIKLILPAGGQAVFGGVFRVRGQ